MYFEEETVNEIPELDRINQYEIRSTLGQGSFGVVKLAIDANTKKKCAIKIFHKSSLKKKREIDKKNGKFTVTTAYDKVQTEIAIMKKLIHPNIVQLYEVIDGNEDFLFMVLEYVEAGDCMRYDPVAKTFHSKLTGGVLSEELASRHMEDIFNGLSFLHINHICHLDLKPENILLGKDGHVKIADFGVSHLFEEELGRSYKSLKQILKSKSRGQLQKTEGSHYFWSPEICEGSETFSGYAADIWASGIILWIFLFGTIPYPEPENMLEIFETIQTHEFVVPDHISLECADLLLGLLRRTPEQRITPRDALQHPWIVMYHTDEDNNFEAVPSLQVEVSHEEVMSAYSWVENISRTRKNLLSTLEDEKVNDDLSTSSENSRKKKNSFQRVFSNSFQTNECLIS